MDVGSSGAAGRLRHYHRAVPLWTIGHSAHPAEHWLALLDEHGIEVVADVRSSPYSRFAPQYNRESVEAALRGRGRRYVFLGRELGGRPEGDEFYDDEGHVLYGRVAQSPLFGRGLERLLRGAAHYRVAVMCSEEDPTSCHRRLLVARVAQKQGVETVHIRGDGTLQSDADLDGGAQGDLFDGFEERAWRSTRSVSPRRPQLSSSGS